MTYGCISDDMRKHIESRAKDGNVFGRFTLEPEWCGNQHEYPCDMECGCFEPEDLMSVSIIIEGALDEEFDIESGGFEVNIADWIVEKLISEKVGNFWVLVSDGEGNTRYSAQSEF
jgi:hypothetical protein